MRTEKITKTYYKFDELPDDVKEIVINKLSDINVDYEWWDSVYEDAKEIGLKIHEFDIDRRSYCKGSFTLSAAEVAQNILNNHGEMCETYKTAQSFLAEWQPIFNDYMDEASKNYESSESEDALVDIEAEFEKSLCEDYRIILTKEYEYLTIEQAIIETIKANDYEFEANGSLA